VPSRKRLDGPSGWPLASTPIGAGNCWLAPCPTIAATTGAKIATSTMRTITLSEIIDALSCSSRCVASRHGLRPSIFFAAGATSASGPGADPARACSEACGMFKAMMSLP